ncbi:hypothetical protein BS756_00635 [Staphylococcus sp. MB371]|uniref:hypothetical protein n=1 Tax=Mammaliicoccus sciuri TaxID=1296 RepID=UPI000991A516|nr:hypothetical protein [Mammaliicoccus sciuri]OOV39522.1 hypothetical protein BS756_00635 [Staphylococcus sp. MB371]
MFDLTTLLNVDVMHFVNTFVANDWDFGNLLKNATTSLKGWGALFLTLLGTAAFIIGGWYLFRILTGSQQKGRFALQAVLAVIIGGVLAFGGLNMLSDFAQGGNKTVKELGK